MKEFKIKLCYENRIETFNIRCPTWSKLIEILKTYKKLNFKYIEIERKNKYE